MLRIVIAMASDDFGRMLECQLNTEHSVVRCFDGKTALDLLQHLRPDALLIDLSLPLLDGLSVLEQAQDQLPDVVYAVTHVMGVEVCQRAEALGVTGLYLMPVASEVFMEQLRESLAQMRPSVRSRDVLKRRIVQLLSRLSFKSNLTGYQQICVGIPLVIEDMGIAMCKELYPQIAAITGQVSDKSIEHTIRTAIEDAWQNGDKELWKQHFPIQANRRKPYPSNKQFFTAIANMLLNQE